MPNIGGGVTSCKRAGIGAMADLVVIAFSSLLALSFFLMRKRFTRGSVPRWRSRGGLRKQALLQSLGLE